ncbi:MAG TPA: hypothetical protein VFP72_23925, partial [Kineosporiaceae bacterium]|nr:hypothetical protein [Kineosporiaceae bacterium]
GGGPTPAGSTPAALGPAPGPAGRPPDHAGSGPGHEPHGLLHSVAEWGEAHERYLQLAEGGHHGSEAALHAIEHGGHGGGSHGGGGPERDNGHRNGPEATAEGGEPASVVETVNPNYPAPPGTQEQLDRMSQDIQVLLAGRARARARQAEASRVASSLQAQAEQINQAQAGIDETAQAASAHQGEVADTSKANTRSEQGHEKAGQDISGGASELTGVATLETLLAGWSGFTGLVLRFDALLPDRAVSAFRQMNDDSTRFMGKLVSTKEGITLQKSLQPSRGAAIAQAGQRIDATSEQAQSTQAGLTQSKERAADLVRNNQEHRAHADAEQEKASDEASRAESSAGELQSRHDTLAQQLQAWAQAHAAAREEAIAQTVARMEARGLRVTHRP